jgi:GT2 family glycosyltransferase
MFSKPVLTGSFKTLDLSIIIINWNSAAFVRKCLETVYGGTTGLEFEIIVVDNASFDGCGDIIRNEFPAVKFIQSLANLGFARANNLGVREAQGRNILFLNPDTEVIGDALCRMARFLDGSSNAAIVGCKLLNTDFSLQTSCVQAFPSILNRALDTEYLHRAFPKLSLWGTRALWADGTPVEVEVIAGACLMMRSEVFKEIGQFSSNYFMYAEDTDLCFKVKQAGYRNYYLSDAVVVHHGGRSSDRKSESNFASIMMRESILEFMRIRRGPLYAAAYQASTVVSATARVLLLMMVCPFALGEDRRASFRRALVKWVKVLRWGLGMETWSRQLATTRPSPC